MANAVELSLNYTWDGITATDIIYKPSVQTPEIQSLFTILSGIKSKKQLYLPANLEKIVKANEGCSRTSSGSATITNRTLTVSELQVFMEQCYEEFMNTVFEEALRMGIDKADISGTVIETIIMNLIKDAMVRDNFRILSFGDTGSGSADYNQLDGLWPTLIDGVATYCVDRIGSALGSSTLAADTALTYLKAHYEGAPIILKQQPIANRKFYVTGSVYENLMSSYESKSSGSDAQLNLLIDGVSGSLKYRGIEVIPIYAWDAALEADAPLGVSVKHLILYTIKDNHFVGLERASDQGNVGAWYERKDKKVYFEAAYQLGYQYAHCDLQTISF